MARSRWEKYRYLYFIVSGLLYFILAEDKIHCCRAELESHTERGREHLDPALGKVREMKLLAVAAAVAFWGAPALLAEPIIVFNAFGAGQSFVKASGISVDGSQYGYDVIADAFAPSVSVALTEIDVALNHESIGSGSAILYLALDDNNSPGTVIEQWDLTATSSQGSILASTCDVCTDLTAGVRYWVEVGPGATNTFDAWNGANALSGEYAYESSAGGAWTVESDREMLAFDVLGDPLVPEPATAWLLAPAVAALLLTRRRRAA
jgi:hypothetical protein